MKSGPRKHQALVAKTAALITCQLDDRRPEIARAFQQLLIGQVPGLTGDGELIGLLNDVVVGNLDTFFPAIRHDISIEHVDPPAAALEQARRLAQRGVDVNEVVRGYRLAHQLFVEFVVEQIRVAHLDMKLAFDVFEWITPKSFRYIDRVSQAVLNAYQNERDRWLANQNRVRALRVREVLDGAEIDIDEASEFIRYPLRRTHLALIVWCAESQDGNELVAMERFVGELGKALGAHERPLFIGADRVTGWAWIPVPGDAAADAVARLREFANIKTDAPWIATGDPLVDAGGFVRSHRQALLTRSVVLASGSSPTVTTHQDPGLVVVAQFCADLEQARSWVADILGPLACATNSDERMRETLREFLRTGSSFKATADELHLHVNSVKYRVQRAVDRRGKPIADDRLDVEVALLLCHWFGTSVLNSSTEVTAPDNR